MWTRATWTPRARGEDAISSSITVSRSPEEDFLAEQERVLAGLTAQLEAAEDAFATEGATFARFRLHYLHRFAPLYAELDRLEAEIARRLAADDPTPVRRAAAEEAQQRAEESERLRDEAAGEAEPETTEREPDPDLKDLRRRAARQLHPDLAAIDDEEDRVRRNRLMAEVNAAYERGDAAAIERILANETARPEAIKGDDVMSRLQRVIRRIAQVRDRLAELEQLTRDLAGDPLHQLYQQVREAWLAGGDPLAEDEADLRARIASLRAQLAALDAEASRG